MTTKWYDRHSFPTYLLFAASFVLVVMLTEHQLGRLLIAKSHHIRLWVSEVDSSDNSQHLFDWYSFSHLIHGFFFYFLFYVLLGRRKWPVGLALLLTVLVEGGWEIVENSPFVINRYRSETASLDYTGDTILNSTSDILCCALGFALARRMPTWTTLTLVVVLELGCALLIRDNLTLNIIMLLHPSESVKHWQSGRPHL